MGSWQGWRLSTLVSLLLFYLIPVLGGLAVYLALPGERRAGRMAPVALGAIAIGAMVWVLSRSLGPSQVLFHVLAVLAVLAAARVVTHPKPIYSAVYFILLVVSVAGIALLAGAEFLAAALVIIYAGAILVTYAFVIMLAQQASPQVWDTEAREPAFAALAGFLLIAALSGVMMTAHGTEARAGLQAIRAAAGVKASSNTLALGSELMTTYVVAFEAAGVLLLVGIIGGIALATRRLVAPSGGASGGAG